MAMDDLSSLFCCQESVEEMKQKLQCMTYELQWAKMQANEEIRTNRENIKQLLHLLQIACKERDEARDQLQTLLVNSKLFSPANPIIAAAPSARTLPVLSPESPQMKPGKTNSSVTESSETTSFNNTQLSHNSSPGDSLYDVVSPLDICSSAAADDPGNLGFANRPLSFLPEFGTSSVEVSPHAPPTETGSRAIDQDDLIIDNIAGSKPLPEKGKLLQAVMEAGPLLQTLMVAGPLPRWKNPPPLQPLHVAPPVGPMAAMGAGFDRGNTSNSKLKRPLSSRNTSDGSLQDYAKVTKASSQFYGTATASSVLNFGAGGSLGICVSGMVSPGHCFGSQIPVAKSQRIR